MSYVYVVVEEKADEVSLREVFSSAEYAQNYIDACSNPNLRFIRKEVKEEVSITPLKFLHFDFCNARNSEEYFVYNENIGTDSDFNGQPHSFQILKINNGEDRNGKAINIWNIIGRFAYEGDLQDNVAQILHICRDLYFKIQMMEAWGRNVEDITTCIQEEFEMILNREIR